jgi:DNA-binding transcriptional regulator YdaS (Cro superfamily)
MLEQAWKHHLRRAIGLKGSQERLAGAIGCSQSKISWLLVAREEIAVEDALAIERATGGAVSKHDLRPDVFGPPPARSALREPAGAAP